MVENRSLDDFLSSGDEDTEADENEGDGDSDETPDAEAVVDEGGTGTTTSPTPTDADTGDDADAADRDTARDTDATDRSEAEVARADVDPGADAAEFRGTYRWSPDGDDCPACGRHVERRWRDGDRFVCADCKEW